MDREFRKSVPPEARQVQALQPETTVAPQLPREDTLFVAQGTDSFSHLPQDRQLIYRIAEEWHPTDD